MSSRIRRKLSLVLVAVLVGAGAVSAAPAGAAEVPPARFVDGAMHVGGLSRSSAIRAWSDGRRNSIGVFVEETQSVSQGSPATHGQLMRLSTATPLSMVATAKVKQKTIKKTRVIRSWAGIECAGSQ
ncbi:MAG: hypothetical protein EOP37_28575 [Rubrivivax sp.]|nr:MAG: hypothetical protein EOP37_28575 [Rubrivivax sp.]